MEKKKRRLFSAEFKTEAVKLVIEEGMSVASTAVNLGVSDSCLRKWVKQAQIDAAPGTTDALTSEERSELQRLRRENRNLRMEREILKKATAFFVKENA